MTNDEICFFSKSMEYKQFVVIWWIYEKSELTWGEQQYRQSLWHGNWQTSLRKIHLWPFCLTWVCDHLIHGILRNETSVIITVWFDKINSAIAKINTSIKYCYSMLLCINKEWQYSAVVFVSRDLRTYQPWSMSKRNSFEFSLLTRTICRKQIFIQLFSRIYIQKFNEKSMNYTSQVTIMWNSKLHTLRHSHLCFLVFFWAELKFSGFSRPSACLCMWSWWSLSMEM